MHWSAYEIFSVICGLALIGVGLFAPGGTKDRAWALFGGVALIAYGFWVAQQTSGTYFFPIWIFLFPAIAAVTLIGKAVSRSLGQGNDALTEPAESVQPREED